MIRLTAVIEIEGQGRRALTHESNAKSLVIGRDANSDFQIPLTTVSRRHIRIASTDNVYVLEDLGSTHGSLLNGRKLSKGEKKVLRDGDIIELTKARITCNIEVDKVAGASSGENTKMIADRAVAGILGRLGEASGEGPYFRILSGPDEGARFPLAGTSREWSVGRSKDCDLVLNDANVSRKHAIIKKDWNGIAVQDLGSKNGVLVNDQKIGRPRRLKDQDELTVGPIKLVFIDPDADLMASLSEVPGFEQESGEYAYPDEEVSVMGAPGEESGEEGEQDPAAENDPLAETGHEGDEALLDDDDDDDDDEVEGVEDEDEYANIDPNLLKTDERRFPTEWVIIGSVALIILVCVLLLVFIYV